MFREKVVYKTNFMPSTPILQTCGLLGNYTKVHNAPELLLFVAHNSSFSFFFFNVGRMTYMQIQVLIVLVYVDFYLHCTM